MNPLLELRKLLSAKPTTGAGEVVFVSASSVSIRLSEGVATLPLPKNMSLSVGDNVLVYKGNIRGKVKRPADVPVYNI